MTDAEVVSIALRGNVAILTLNRPASLNAMNRAMMGQLVAALSALEKDPSVHCVVIHGAGRAFSAGFDMKEGALAATSGQESSAGARLDEDFEFIMNVWHFPKPIIAAVHGYCLGGAFELALACDITIADAEAQFGEPEVRFRSGIVAMLLPVLVAPKFAAEIILLGLRDVGARRALEMGIANRVAPAGKHLHMAMEMAAQIATYDSIAVTKSKLAIRTVLESPTLREGLRGALLLDHEIEGAAADSRDDFNRTLLVQGVKAAIEPADQALDQGENG